MPVHTSLESTPIYVLTEMPTFWDVWWHSTVKGLIWRQILETLPLLFFALSAGIFNNYFLSPSFFFWTLLQSSPISLWYHLLLCFSNPKYQIEFFVWVPISLKKERIVEQDTGGKAAKQREKPLCLLTSLNERSNMLFWVCGSVTAIHPQADSQGFTWLESQCTFPWWGTKWQKDR